MMLAGCASGPGSFGNGSGIAAPNGAAAPNVTAVGLQVNGAAANRKQEVQFSEAMNPATINNQTFYVADASGQKAPSVVSYDANSNVASFKPNPALKVNASYTLTITTGVASSQGAHMLKNYTSSFKTRAAVDDSPIYVIATNPGRDASCASTTKPITITFSEEPDASTLTSKNIVITGPDGSVLPAMISINISATVVTVTPSSSLPSGNIMVTVDGIGDLADQMMVKPYVWSFSTACSGTGGSSGTGTGSSGGSGSGSSGGTGGTTGTGIGGGTGSTSNSAYVYVSTGPNTSNAGEIYGFAAMSNGTLTPIPGSPHTSTSAIGFLEGAGTYLFATASGTSIKTYSIGSTGAITPVSTKNAQQYDTPSNTGGPVSIFLDATGQTLYDNEALAYNSNYRYQAYDIQQGGSLNFVGVTNYDDTIDSRLSFTSNDSYAYGSDCYKFSTNIYGFTRSSNGALTYFDPHANVPAAAAGQGYCPVGAAVADGTNYVVIALQQTSGNSPSTQPSQFAVYTVNSSNGTLSTTNTAANMPMDAIGVVTDYRFDPTGMYLAVAGDSGLQIFTLRNGVLTSTGKIAVTSGLNQLRWDNAGHVYAINRGSGQLYVFNVAKGVPTMASGSPYALSPGGYYLTVHPLP